MCTAIFNNAKGYGYTPYMESNVEAVRKSIIQRTKNESVSVIVIWTRKLALVGVKYKKKPQ